MIVSLGPRTPVNFIYIGLSIGFKLVLLNSNVVGKFADVTSVIQNAFPIFISERKNQRTLHFFFTCAEPVIRCENNAKISPAGLILRSPRAKHSRVRMSAG